jgi:hypothetical protein
MTPLIFGLISGEALLGALFTLVIWAIILYVLWWGLGKIAPGEPWMKIGTVVLVLITVVVLVNILLGLTGTHLIHW